MKKEKQNRSLISLLVGIMLLGVGIFMTYNSTKIVDLNKVKIIINDNEHLWRFMSFIPMLILMFAGALAVINSIFASKVFTIMIILINIGLTIFVKSDLYGFVSIVKAYEDSMNYLYLIVLISSLMLLIELLINRIGNRKLLAQQKEKAV